MRGNARLNGGKRTDSLISRALGGDAASGGGLDGGHLAALAGVVGDAA